MSTPLAGRPPAPQVFQWISYLQYPTLLVAGVYLLKSGRAIAAVGGTGWQPVYDDWNYVLLYAGIAIGLSSLQDTTKTQNDLSRRVWEDPRRGRLALALLSGYAFGAMALGIAGAYFADDSALKEVSLGLVALGLGFVGLLKAAIEMREHHRSDRRDPAPTQGASA